MSRDGTGPTGPSASTGPTGPIVSSAHLVSERAAELSEFEYGMIVAGNAFQRWVVHCMTAAGLEGLSTLEVLVLHAVNHRARDKRLADLCFMLHIEETHTVNYALKKLVKAQLVTQDRRGKEKFYSTSATGGAACDRYREVREACLVQSLDSLGLDRAATARLADHLRALSGLYDQAARSAASL